MTNEPEAELPRATGELSLQERYGPTLMCFGCGPGNTHGLRLRSFRREGQPGLRASFQPQPYHQAFPGMVNGGIIGALLDCHSNWTAAIAMMDARGAEAPPPTVTADFHVKLRKPTPLAPATPLELVAEVVSHEGDRATVEASLAVNGVVTATCRGTFVAVKREHPAHHLR